MNNAIDDVMRRLAFRYVQSNGSISVSDAEILKFESIIGLRLPEDYRSFLKKYGLASGDDGDFIIPEHSTAVEVFYGLAPTTSYDLLRHRKVLADRLPDAYLAIASSPGGEIVLSLAGQDTGTVYWWNREGRFETTKATQVAPNFSALVNTLAVE